MIRRFTAFTFLLVMALTITLKHPVLGYCMCLDSYFTGACECQVVTVTVKVTESPESSADANCPSCCSASSCETSSESIECSDISEESAPCDDCVKQLVIDVGEFIWHGSDKLPIDVATTLPPTLLLSPEFDLLLAANFSYYTPMSIRGDPPLGIYHSDLPHYLSHSVMRL